MPTLESIRRVRIQYTSDGAEKAEADARGVAAAQDELGRTSEVVSIATERAARRQLSATAAYERQKVALDSTLRSQQIYERQMRVIERAQEQAAISADEAAASIARVREAYQSAGSPRGSVDQSDINRLLGVQAQVQGAAAQSAAVFEEAARETAQFQSRAAALRAELDPVAAAQERLNKEMAEYSVLAAQGHISTGELAAAHGQARARFDATEQAARKAASGIGVNSGQMANLTYQLNDMAVMLASGQNPFIMLMQQGMQMAQIFGPGVGLMGALKGVGAAVVAFLTNPLTLAVAALAATAGAVSWLASRSSSGAEDVEQLNDELRALGLLSKQASADAEVLAVKLRNLAPDEVRESLRRVRERLDDLTGFGSIWDRLGLSDDRQLSGLQAIETRLRSLAAANASFVVGSDRNTEQLALNLANMVEGFRNGDASAEILAATMRDIATMDITGALDGYMAAIRSLYPEVDALIKRQAQLTGGAVGDPNANSRVAGAFGVIDREGAMDRLRSGMNKEDSGPGFGDLTAQAQERTAALEAEAAALEMTNGQAEAYRFTKEMIAAATAQDIELSPTQLEQLYELGEAYANAQLKLDGMRLTMENRGPFETLQQDLANLKEMVDAGAISWETYADAQRRATAEAHATVAGYASDVMGIMGQLFEDNKAVAIANAIVSTYEGVAKSLAKYPMPWAAVMAAAHLALGMKQVMAIKSTNKTSKSASGGGGGGGASPSAGAASGGSQEAVQRQAISIALYGDTVKAESVEEMVKKINQNTVDGGTPLITIQRMAS